MDPATIIMIALQALNLLNQSGIFGGEGDDQTTTQVTQAQQEPRGWQSQIPGMLEMPLMQMMLGRYDLLSGAGMPGGVGATSPWTQELMNLINAQMPQLIAGLGGRGMKRPFPTGGLPSPTTGSISSLLGG